MQPSKPTANPFFRVFKLPTNQPRSYSPRRFPTFHPTQAPTPLSPLRVHGHQTLEESQIDAENRRRFNLENNNHDEAFLQQERQEIDDFLRQIRTARSLEKNLIEMEESLNATETSEPLGEDDEVYSVKNQTMVLAEKRVILEEEEKEGVDSVIVNDTQTLTPESLRKETSENERADDPPLDSENVSPTELVRERTPVLFSPKKDIAKAKAPKPKAKGSSLSKTMKELTQYEKELFQTIQKLKTKKPNLKTTVPKKPEPPVASSATWTRQDGSSLGLLSTRHGESRTQPFHRLRAEPQNPCRMCRVSTVRRQRGETVHGQVSL